MYKMRTRKQRRAAERRSKGRDLEVLALKMRENPEKGEELLKNALEIVSKEKGWDIREQVVFKPYIVDFCAVNCGFVFEADGQQHQWRDRRLKDERRDRYLTDTYGLKVFRFLNIELREHFDFVLNRLRDI